MIRNISPINVNNNSTTAAGAIKGNIKANVEAKRIERTQKLIANEGSYVLGYIANVQHQIKIS